MNPVQREISVQILQKQIQKIFVPGELNDFVSSNYFFNLLVSKRLIRFGRGYTVEFQIFFYDLSFV